MALENVMRVDNGNIVDGRTPLTYPAQQVIMSDGVTSVEDAVDEVTSGLTGRLLTYENVTVTPGTFLWIANVATGRSKVYCGYAKNANVIVYVAEAIDAEIIQLYARNLGADSVTTTIYLKEIG